MDDQEQYAKLFNDIDSQALITFRSHSSEYGAIDYCQPTRVELVSQSLAWPSAV